MSSHPYGLRGDPFASPATLSAKDASRLIRRRVRAFNGDGGDLFPIDTCDLIHENAGGIPDAMLALAGRAMHIAAAEGAPAVLPTHVRQAIASAIGNAPRTADVTAAASPGAAPTHDETAGGEDDVAHEPGDEAATDDVVRTRSEIPTRAQIAARAQAVLAWEESPAIADDDPDLPAFHPAAFALPNQPSEGLEPDARDWVSRFIVPSAGVANRPDSFTHAAPATAGRSAAASAPGRRSLPASPVSDADAVESALAAAYGHAAPRRSPLPRRPRRRRRSGNQGLLIAVAAVCVVAFIVRMSVRGSLVPTGSEPQRPVQTSTRPAEPPASAPKAPAAPRTENAPADREPAPAVVPPAATVIDEPLIGPHSAAQRLSTSPPLTASGTPPESAVPVRREASYGKFGLEVATFIFEERARVERDRLASNGLRARLITTVEYGSRVYRVVVGGFPDPAAAERAADSLLSNGMVLQARVIRNH